MKLKLVLFMIIILGVISVRYVFAQVPTYDIGKRHGILALRWLARSPYADYQRQLDETQRSWMDRLFQLQSQYNAKLKELQLANYNERLQELRNFMTQWNKILGEIQSLKAQMQYQAQFPEAQSVNAALHERIRKLEKEANDFVDKIVEEQAIPSVDEAAKETIEQVEQVKPQTSTRKKKRTYTYETPTNYAGVSAVVDESGNVVGYHDYGRQMSYGVGYEPKEETQKESYKETPKDYSGVSKVVDESGNVVGYHDYGRQMSYGVGYEPASVPTYDLFG